MIIIVIPLAYRKHIAQASAIGQLSERENQEERINTVSRLYCRLDHAPLSRRQRLVAGTAQNKFSIYLIHFQIIQVCCPMWIRVLSTRHCCSNARELDAYTGDVRFRCDVQKKEPQIKYIHRKAKFNIFTLVSNFSKKFHSNEEEKKFRRNTSHRRFHQWHGCNAITGCVAESSVHDMPRVRSLVN